MKLFELKNRQPDVYDKYLDSLDPKQHKYIKSQSAELLQKRFPDLEHKEAISHASRWIMSLKKPGIKSVEENLLSLVKENDSREEALKLLKVLHDKYVKSGDYNAFELPILLRQHMPELSKQEVRQYAGEFFDSFKSESINEIKMVKTRIGEIPVHDNLSPLSQDEFLKWSQSNPPKSNEPKTAKYSTARYATYRADHRLHVQEQTVNENMIGVPDAYYDADERKEAYDDLQDALSTSSRWQEEMIEQGICPECSGSSYMDGDDENGEDSCYGWGNYGCDQGEMEGATWKEIIEFDKRQAERKNYPGDEKVAQQYARIPNADIHSISQQLQADYPHLSPSGRARVQSLINKIRSKSSD